MRFTIIMAALKKGASGVLERVPSAGTSIRNKPKGTPVRGFHPNSSPVYKTQSESALTSGVRNLSVNDDKGISRRALSSRNENVKVRTLADAASLLQSESVKNVVLVAGAGISTPSGIPDFRSPGTGLYDNLQQYQIPYPEAIFDIDYFHVNPRPFFTLAKELYPSGKYRPNYIHYFAKLLHDKGQLLRMYTQNIDGLERLAGLPAEKLVEAHGTFATATCTTCRQKYTGEEIKEKIFADKLPRCPTRGCVGIVKPDIVFFGEDLPRKFYSYMKDMLQTDMVIVMGTSLEVQPFAGIIDTVRWTVPRVLFNREAVGPFKHNRRAQDIVAAGDLVDNMVKFSTMIGWKEDMVNLITKEEGEFKIINNPPPAPKNPNQTRNYSTLAYQRRAMFSNSDDSSSEESTESDSDVTSSDSSDQEVNRIRKFKGFTRGKSGNIALKNGANTGPRNGFRASSAKLGDTNTRKLHTETIPKGTRTVNGSLTGRSVKSESGLNESVAKRRLDRKQQTGGQGENIANKNISVSEKNRVLRKYGLSPSPNVIPKETNILQDMQKPVRGFLKNKNNIADKPSDMPGNDKMMKESLLKKKTSETELSEEKPAGGFAIRNDLVKSENSIRNGNLGKTDISSTKDINGDATAEDTSILTTEEANGNKNTEEKNIVAVEMGIRKESPLTDLRREHFVVSGYFIEDVAKDSNNDGPVTSVDHIPSDTPTELFGKDSNLCKDTTNELGRHDNMKKFDETSERTGPGSITSSTKDKKGKHLSNKTVKSFAKFASIHSQRKVVGQTRGKIKRKTLRDKPPTGKNNTHVTELSQLNDRPYGYAYRQKAPIRGIGPFHRTNVRTLNSSIEFTQEIRSGSAELPKINYRHKIQPANKYDARMFGMVGQVDSSTDEDTSDSR